MTQIALGEVEEGVARLRRAIEIAREIDDVDGLAEAYSNLADLLNLQGRTREAIETVQEGLAAVPRRLADSRHWMMLTLSELQFEAGDWEDARANLGPPPLAADGSDPDLPPAARGRAGARGGRR